MEEESEMKNAIETVLDRAHLAYSRCKTSLKTKAPRLVAVSKTRPKEDIIESYGYGQIYFGENYVQELYEKANDPEIISKCDNIKWHFIGHCQTNKIPKLISVPNLHMMETVHSSKFADALNKARLKQTEEPLNIMIQVNTSGEMNKNGLLSSEVDDVVQHILTSCPVLKFQGLMTIGSYEHSVNSDGVNPDFKELTECRRKLCEELNLNLESVELSMGMSHDYETAVEMGSTNIRVGSNIFGVRSSKE